MTSISDEKIKKIIQKVKARRGHYLKGQTEKAIEGVSPEVIQAVRDLDRINADQRGGKDFMVMAKEYQAQHGCRLIDAMMAISRQHPEAHEEYIRRANT